MNKQELLTALNEKLKGQKWDGVYSVSYDIVKVASNLLKQEGLRDAITMGLTCDNYKSSTFYLRYHGTTSITLYVKRVRGDYHWSYFSKGHYDWAYGDITSDSEDFTFIKKACEIDNEHIKQEHAKNKMVADMTEKYKKIVELFGEETNSIINYLSRHYWDIEKSLVEDKAKKILTEIDTSDVDVAKEQLRSLETEKVITKREYDYIVMHYDDLVRASL